jgi:diaminohydroxyphosphoribosylaminopyrimidine deaminase/5-amino-6-(5-phosphoribosylamino)uracil reductase
MSINQSKDSYYLKLAFQQAEINLGSTSPNPSVGCVIVKNNSVISSGHTTLKGRPHAEANALNRKLNFRNAKIFITLEPCSHYGKTPPCINKIINKKLDQVVFSINDTDPRSKNFATTKLKKNKIKVKKFILKSFAKIFYKSYFLQTKKNFFFIDGKLAISNDYSTINKKKRWITNQKSRKLANFIRSKYDCILSTSKTLNDDNPLMNCRVEGLERKTPDLVIIDRGFKIKKNLKIFKNKNRKIYVFTFLNNNKKEKFLKKKGVNIIKLKKNDIDVEVLKAIFLKIKHLGFNRILVEAGTTFLNKMIKYNFLENFYLFKSSLNLSSNGSNNSSTYYLKKFKLTEKNKIKVNLKDDNLYKIKL